MPLQIALSKIHSAPMYVPKLIELKEHAERRRFEHAVRSGLRARPRSLPSMYFYDEVGSELFRKIMELPEYYLTRVEREILTANAESIVAPFFAPDVRPRGCDVIDLGAGDGLKTRALLERFKGHDVRYFPIDVSPRALMDASAACARSMPWLPVVPVNAEYFAGLSRAGQEGRPRLVLLLGSNIGNLERAEAYTFFRKLRDALRPGDRVLVGFDLIKDVPVIERAYDDLEGVTERFNLNLLRRINRELDGHFAIENFFHRAVFSPARNAMESYLVSKKRQSVRIGHGSYEFARCEPILTEISCKYTRAEPSAFARHAGFVEVEAFTDPDAMFLDALWCVPENPRTDRPASL